MNLFQQVESVHVLNIDTEKSNMTSNEIVAKQSCNSHEFVVSNVDEELIILLQFKQVIELHSLKIFALESSIQQISSECDASQPKQIHIYRIDNLNIDFNDISSMKPDKSIKCFSRKLEYGQCINLKKDSKNALRFNNTKYLAIYIESNQNETEKTYLNSISIKGEIKGNFAINYEFDSTKMGNDKKLQEIAKEYNNQHIATHYIDSSYLVQHHSEHKQCDLEKCECLQRITHALKAYNESMLRLNQQKMNIDDIFMNDYDDKTALNDFHHLLTFHHHQFENIYKRIVEECNNHEVCKLSECLMMRRNQRDRCNEKSIQLYLNVDDADGISRQQIWDKIHCHYFHSFDIGYRISQRKIQQIINIDDSDDKKEDDTYEVNDKMVKAISNFAHKTKLSYANIDTLHRLNSETVKFSAESLIYSFGVKFYYWPYYKDNQELYDVPCALNCKRPVIAVNGWRTLWYKTVDGKKYFECGTLGDYYVAAKFRDFKEELINNPISCLSPIQWNITLSKANIHLETDYFKDKKCQLGDSMKYYRINYDSWITIDHLAAMMFYCNFNILQRKFSETFRPMSENESTAKLKLRHSNYAHFGRLLTESVIAYAPTSWMLHGYRSLYHGTTIKSQFSTVYTIINGPISTTTDYMVALQFCNNTGMILEFGLDSFWRGGWGSTGGTGGFESISRLRMFECSFLSDYPNEQEMFFIGGWSHFVMKTITMVPGGSNYRFYVRALAGISEFFEPHVEQGVAFTWDEKEKQTLNQMRYRILLHQLHRHFPKKKQYTKLKSMPPYAEDLVVSHFVSMKSIEFTAEDINNNINHNNCWNVKLQSILDTLFCYDNGWINLELFMRVFSGVVLIRNKKKFDEIFLFEEIYPSLATFVRNHPDTSLVTIELYGFSAQHTNEVIINELNSKLEKFGWRASMKLSLRLENIRMI